MQLESKLIAADLPREDRQDTSQLASLHLKKSQAVQTECLSSAVAEELEEEQVVSACLKCYSMAYCSHH